MLENEIIDTGVSTHSRLKAAEENAHGRMTDNRFNTQPPKGGCIPQKTRSYDQPTFQHTAA